MLNGKGLMALSSMTPEIAAGLEILLRKLRNIKPIGFPRSWDQTTAIEVLTCLREFVNTADREKLTGEEGVEIEVSPFAAEVLDDLITHIQALDKGQSDHRLLPRPGGGSPASTEQEMRNAVLALVSAKAEQYRKLGGADFKAQARKDVEAEGLKWPTRDGERAINKKLLESWEKRQKK